MSMQTVAIVKTLGQVEILFSLLISAFFFKEKLAKTDHLGLWLVIVAAIMVIWAQSNDAETRVENIHSAGKIALAYSELYEFEHDFSVYLENVAFPQLIYD